ncbi:Cof-type HAD-IIB family hydrolase [Dubosiella newyorkensis]|uniref:Hydrolase n=1 Tax=Dubosiella newyorkensis TaxID=1862672 RepID=A0A1U7NPG6_9FIRM|nr:Cof-type HAD-IIB family hydrolase [Dubosiella newyorkensis]OLU47499.1 hydrolase [Dubosiella newyorkensis]
MIKILAFDLDGTLLKSDKSMDVRTVEAIERAKAQGMHIVIASGRDKNGCKFVYEPLELEEGPHFLALVNGQIIYDFAHKEYDLDDVLSTEDGLKIQEVCRKYNVEGIFCCGYDFYSYISRLGRLKKNVKNLVLGEPTDYGLKAGSELRNFIDLPYKDISLKQDINKVCLVHSASFFEKNIEKMKEDLKDFDVLLVGPGWMEIMPKGVSKASAIEKIAKKLGYSMENVMAFGDAENDIEMIKEAGIGVAMGNGMDSVKKVADVVTSSNDENGIGQVIDDLLEGNENLLKAGIV